MHGVLRAGALASTAATDTSGSVFAISWQRILAEAKLYWPRKTAEHLARITGASIRTCYRWLGADVQPPAGAIIKVVAAIRAEYLARGKIFEQLDLGF